MALLWRFKGEKEEVTTAASAARLNVLDVGACDDKGLSAAAAVGQTKRDRDGLKMRKNALEVKFFYYHQLLLCRRREA